jgi:hypothetical protein
MAPAFVVYPFVGQPLALLLRGSARTVTTTVLAALAVVALVRAREVPPIFVALVAFLRGRRVSALIGGHVALLLLASIIVVSGCSLFLSVAAQPKSPAQVL